ncbi:nitrite reductase [Corynebacterium sp. NML98-0116]|uniref:Polysulfide reductase NrfD n=2 Tax=Corynebacterium TaxID=1716 RepID=A0ABD4TQU7_9CORY|nr:MULTISPECIES: NrfD/PsrC family molybdoenzyme membrane anchor subunit [Corynebacterium]AOX05846.1 nitrite reductase [Corynebacterium sp. NML98-0116]MCO6394110.1 polysulfide reductase NrfD [Corynebacterium lipophilum]MCQ4609383.1 polysulfide reductase NrfD [Corynebacterium sp. CCUG 61414]MCQ4613711.1 polysulfide reductase NrfD [Corynebacterium pseudogenitalium]MCZ2116456.1 polysulfide reductase NrfD [Corynebacterium lipophilum]
MAEFDSYRPPQEPRRPRRRDQAEGERPRGPKKRRGEELMVPEASFEHFDSYYGKPIVKFPPWEWPIGVYFFLGGLAGGSSLLAVGADATGNKELRRNMRISSMAAAAVGSGCLVLDLGRPERLLNMFRVFKLSSPMSVGSWLLGSFSALQGLAMLPELDELTGKKLPLPSPLRSFIEFAATPAGIAGGVLASPLAAYTAVLIGNTSVPAWQEAGKNLPFVFVSSATAATGGMGLLTTSTENAAVPRALGVVGAAADVAATSYMTSQLDDVSKEAFSTGKAGKLFKASEVCLAVGGVGALFSKKSRVLAGISGVALMAGSCLTRFAVLEAGKQSTEDPKYVVEPQRERLRKRREAGKVDDGITTA